MHPVQSQCAELGRAHRLDPDGIGESRQLRTAERGDARINHGNTGNLRQAPGHVFGGTLHFSEHIGEGVLAVIAITTGLQRFQRCAGHHQVRHAHRRYQRDR
jgi:hypothetical protein